MPTISEIEDAIVERLQERLTTAGKIAVQKGIEGFPQPALYVSTEDGTLTRSTADKYKQSLKIYLDIIFKHLGNEKERRRGIYLILEGAIQTLIGQDLGLKINPLEVKGFRNTTSKELTDAGLLAFSIEVATSHYLTIQSDEAITDLMTVGLAYYLREPLDATADSADAVDLPLLPKG